MTLHVTDRSGLGGVDLDQIRGASVGARLARDFLPHRAGRIPPNGDDAGFLHAARDAPRFKSGILTLVELAQRAGRNEEAGRR